jgi:hypothetical protein
LITVHFAGQPPEQDLIYKLSKKFNFIADYNNNGVQVNIQTEHITDDGFITSYQPAFVHVYHNWGNKSWPIWQWIESNL